MEKVIPRTLSGFMELLPADQINMEKIKRILQDTYSSYGFYPLDTPVIESSEVLLAKGGGDTEKQIYRFAKGDSNLALRFDLTVPLAKYVALHYNDLQFPFKRYQIGKVYRGERSQRGRFREFYQADIDIIGDGALDIADDAEVPAIIYQVFQKLGITEFQFHINNRKILNGFYVMNGMSSKAGEIMRAIDKIDKIGPVMVRKILTEDIGMYTQKADTVLDFMSIKGNKEEVFERLSKFRGMNAQFDEGLDELIIVSNYLKSYGVPEEFYEIDLSIARGLDYYTGTVYETTLKKHPEIGSVCSGGRYDNLAEFYTDKQLPGVGLSIGLTRLFYILSEHKMFSEANIASPCDVLVLPMGECNSEAIKISKILRDAGIRTSVYLEKKKWKQKLSYANKMNVPYSLILGENEISKGIVSIKDMKTGEQVSTKLQDGIMLIKCGIEQKNVEKIVCDA